MAESDLVRNERLKALGLMFHNLAAACVVAAVVVPLVGASTTGAPALRFLAAAPIGLLLAVGCVMLGQRILGDLHGGQEVQHGDSQRRASDDR